MTSPSRGARTDLAVFTVSGGLLVAFVITALAAPAATSEAITAAFNVTAGSFGALWQVLLLATFVVAIVLAVSRCGNVRLGDRNGPEYGRFNWLAMIMSTLLAGGGVFFAAGEPLQHFVTPPPIYGDVRPGSQEAVSAALAQSFADWGFLAWAVLGSLGSIVMMRGVQRGMPLRPRTLLYPLLGERVRHSWMGTAVDITCIIAVVAGTVGPIGFLGLQVSYGLSQVFGTPDSYPVQLAVIVVLTAIAVLSVITGIDRGIQFLSRLNIWLAGALMAAFLVLGSAGFLVDSFLGGFAKYMRDFVPLALYRGDEQWLGSWTVFFFGWFLGYAPLMSMFVARISRGRTLRDLVVSTSVVAPIATMLWFTVFGGTGIWFERNQPGLLSGTLATSGTDAAVISIAEQLPLGQLITIGLLLLTITFVATTTDSMSYSIAAAGTRRGEPAVVVRAFWGVLMGAAAAALILIGDGGISALQYFIVITAVPVGFVMLTTVWTAPRMARRMAVEQGVLSPPPQGTPTTNNHEMPHRTTVCVRDAETGSTDTTRNGSILADESSQLG